MNMIAGAIDLFLSSSMFPYYAKISEEIDAFGITSDCIKGMKEISSLVSIFLFLIPHTFSISFSSSFSNLLFWLPSSFLSS